jgi:hypothetical protein
MIDPEQARRLRELADRITRAVDAPQDAEGTAEFFDRLFDAATLELTAHERQTGDLPQMGPQLSIELVKSMIENNRKRLRYMAALLRSVHPENNRMKTVLLSCEDSYRDDAKLLGRLLINIGWRPEPPSKAE